MQWEISDIGWGNLYVSRWREQFMSFAEWYRMDNICFMMKVPEPYPKILALIFPFDSVTWVLLFLTFAVIIMLYLLYAATSIDR